MPPLEDLRGKKFARLLVESRAENSKNNRAQWNCLCDCGNRIVALSYNLKNGNTQSCGCLQRERTSEATIKDIIGKRFSRLVAKDRITIDEILCICDCGKEVIVSYRNLINGNTKSCGCYKSDYTSKRMSVDMIGKTCGDLTVIKRLSKPGSSKSPKFLCKCSCGMYTITTGNKLRTGHTQSCGHLRNSKPEAIIVHYLRALGISFKKDFMFKDLLSEKGYPLRFDFKINTENGYFLLEYQGIQHYKEQANEFGKQQREVTDIQKKEYCKEHNIELVEIRYDEDIIKSLTEILKSHNLEYDNPVPSSQEIA